MTSSTGAHRAKVCAASLAGTDLAAFAAHCRASNPRAGSLSSVQAAAAFASQGSFCSTARSASCSLWPVKRTTAAASARGPGASPNTASPAGRAQRRTKVPTSDRTSSSAARWANAATTCGSPTPASPRRAERHNVCGAWVASASSTARRSARGSRSDHRVRASRRVAASSLGSGRQSATACTRRWVPAAGSTTRSPGVGAAHPPTPLSRPVSETTTTAAVEPNARAGCRLAGQVLTVSSAVADGLRSRCTPREPVWSRAPTTWAARSCLRMWNRAARQNP